MIFESKKIKKLPSYGILEVELTTFYLRSLLKDETVNCFV